MTKGYYEPSDIRRDGLLKLKKLKERDAIANPRPQCEELISSSNYLSRKPPPVRQCSNTATKKLHDKDLCTLHYNRSKDRS